MGYFDEGVGQAGGSKKIVPSEREKETGTNRRGGSLAVYQAITVMLLVMILVLRIARADTFGISTRSTQGLT